MLVFIVVSGRFIDYFTIWNSPRFTLERAFHLQSSSFTAFSQSIKAAHRRHYSATSLSHVTFSFVCFNNLLCFTFNLDIKQIEKYKQVKSVQMTSPITLAVN